MTPDDPLSEALRLVSLAESRGIVVRLMGGLAFHAQAPTWTARIDRSGRDIDLATRSDDRKALSELLVAEGYTPDRQYNALYGHKQLYFVDEPRNRPVDVLVDRMEMCHGFAFRDRLTVSTPTLPLAELLLTKLQIVKINRKDVLDALILLASHPLAADSDGAGEGSDARAAVNVSRITALTSADWGWWRTVTGNLAALRSFVESDLAPGDLDTGAPLPYDVRAQLDALAGAIEAAPKSARWRFRARVGDRMTWYEEPEEVGHGRG
ncbi:MAG TPA: hypothetical protein VFJ71_09620 [Candidatus Limnocylindrales bacterium]|nr:hypothetical protein [Candidatus Limnocylindrales bacterium]